ncbi:MAG: hypothetical protein HZA50_11655 [Planctomycetes bacterium]|nr:hypothetical protein [Planctomycetota bacterium]
MSTADKPKLRKMALIASGEKFQLAGSLDESREIPRQRFVKDIMRTGVYRHPKNGWTLDVTPERMDRWIASFRAMRENGVDAEIVVDHSVKAADVQGELVDMARDGDTLYAVHEFVGQDAINLAKKCKNVSVLIEKDFRDGQGNSYGEAITHSSLVQQPVMPGQLPFMPIAASLAGLPNSGIEPFVLSVEGNDPDHKKTQENNMSAEEITLKLADVRTLLGAGDDLTAENAAARLAEHLKKNADARAATDKQILDLKTQVESLSKKAASLKTETDRQPDPDVLDQLAEGAEDRIDGLVSKSRITPAVAASLKDLLVGKAGGRNAWALSRNVSGTDESLIRGIVKALEANDVVKLGEQTKGQRIEMSRNSPGGEEPDHDPKVTSNMVEMAGGAAKK